MDESGIENSVGSGQDSKVAQLSKSKALKVALAAVGTLGASSGVKSLTDDISADTGEHRASVTVIPGKADSTGTESGQAQNAERVNQQESEFFNLVFHDLTPEQRIEARATVNKYKNDIAAKSNYEEAHQYIPVKYMEIIEGVAKEYGISKEALEGIISVENGGGEDVTNEISGARGVAQFMRETAESEPYKLIEDGKDKRGDPVLSIDAAGLYLRNHKALFGGDEGLAIWSYHAGVGNVYQAMKFYFLNKYGKDIGDNVDSLADSESEVRKLMAEDRIDIHKLLTNQAVQDNVTSGLADYSPSYTYQVIGAAELLNEQKVQRSTTATWEMKNEHTSEKISEMTVPARPTRE